MTVSAKGKNMALSLFFLGVHLDERPRWCKKTKIPSFISCHCVDRRTKISHIWKKLQEPLRIWSPESVKRERHLAVNVYICKWKVANWITVCIFWTWRTPTTLNSFFLASIVLVSQSSALRPHTCVHHRGDGWESVHGVLFLDDQLQMKTFWFTETRRLRKINWYDLKSWLKKQQAMNHALTAVWNNHHWADRRDWHQSRPVIHDAAVSHCVQGISQKNPSRPFSCCSFLFKLCFRLLISCWLFFFLFWVSFFFSSTCVHWVWT